MGALKLVVHPKASNNVLNIDNSVIHQPTNCDRQTAQSHGVNGQSKIGKNQCCDADRDRNSCQSNNCWTNCAQKHK